ncbi:MAG: DUF1080 domain-containing protein, partial [Thermoguttaceae bacterium]
PHSALSQRILNEIAAAKICLFNPDKKADYDTALRSSLADPVPPCAPEPAVVPAPPVSAPRAAPPVSAHRRRQARLLGLTIAGIVLGLATIALLLSVGGEKPEARSPAVEPSPKATEIIVILFDGKTLNGWRPRDPQGGLCWSVRDGALACDAQLGGSDLISELSFQDFELHLEFLLERGANSGVYLRGRYEIQLIDARNRRPGNNTCGAICTLIPPTSNAYRGAGQWNSLDVKLVGRHVTVTMNGQRIIDDQEIPRPTAAPLDDLETQPGPIMLQRWGDGVTMFRNIQVRGLMCIAEQNR